MVLKKATSQTHLFFQIDRVHRGCSSGTVVNSLLRSPVQAQTRILLPLPGVRNLSPCPGQGQHHGQQQMQVFHGAAPLMLAKLSVLYLRQETDFILTKNVTSTENGNRIFLLNTQVPTTDLQPTSLNEQALLDLAQDLMCSLN